ncbi:MAG TPA: hypothetical protein VGL24_13845, partial [Chthoniobacterales bacterium]
MKNNKIEIASATPGSPQLSGSNGTSRRTFLGKVGAALAGSVVLAKAASASGQTARGLIGDGVAQSTALDPRVKQAYQIRKAAALAEGHIPVPPHTTNGDEQLYSDKSGTYS